MAVRLAREKKAASPAISMVIITSVTIVLVSIAANYAYQVLDRQQGASELEAATKSIVTFDDAVRDVAWDRGGSRSTRFTLNRGYMNMALNKTLGVTVSDVQSGGYSTSYSTSTGYLWYSLPTDYVNYGNGYEAVILGDNETIISGTTESIGRVLLKQESGTVSIILSYRVHAWREGLTILSDATPVNYVDIMIVRISVTRNFILSGDFDLVARNVGLTTVSRGPYTVGSGNTCSVSVNLDGATSSLMLDLDPGMVVFNFIISDVRIST